MPPRTWDPTPQLIHSMELHLQSVIVARARCWGGHNRRHRNTCRALAGLTLFSSVREYATAKLARASRGRTRSAAVKWATAADGDRCENPTTPREQRVSGAPTLRPAATMRHLHDVALPHGHVGKEVLRLVGEHHVKVLVHFMRRSHLLHAHAQPLQRFVVVGVHLQRGLVKLHCLFHVRLASRLQGYACRCHGDPVSASLLCRHDGVLLQLVTNVKQQLLGGIIRVQRCFVLCDCFSELACAVQQLSYSALQAMVARVNICTSSTPREQREKCHKLALAQLHEYEQAPNVPIACW